MKRIISEEMEGTSQRGDRVEDGKCTEDYDGTYTITRNKLEHIKRQRKMEKISFSN